MDLREEEPQGPRPEEILALQYEYGNMNAWEQAYELFAEESKEAVPLGLYKSKMSQGPPSVITTYSFPSVRIEGDHATIDRVYTWEEPDEEGQHKATQEAVLEDEGWRILMREEQYKFYLGE